MPTVKNLWPSPSMMIISGTWGPVPTFKLFPISKDCPYVECIYNPNAQTLAVIGLNLKDQFHMVPRLDENGSPVEIKNAKKDPQDPYKKQRVTVSSYSEYYITGEKEITAFLEKVAINHADYDTKKFLDIKPMDSPKAVEAPPLIITDNIG